MGFRAQLPQPTSGGAVTIEHEAALPAGPCQNKTFDMTCGDSGAWLNLRSCVPITCPKPAATGGHNASTEPAGRLAFGQAFHAEVAHCPEGHRPNVSLPLPICNDSCQLSGSQCRPVDCGPYPTLLNSTWQLTSQRSGAGVSNAAQLYQGGGFVLTCRAGMVTPPRHSTHWQSLAPRGPFCAEGIHVGCTAAGVYNVTASPSLCEPATCPPYRNVDPYAIAEGTGQDLLSQATLSGDTISVS